MAGRPKRRMRLIEAGILAPPQVASPPEPEPAPPPPVVRMIKQKIDPLDWVRMSDLEKIKASYGMNLDQVRDICSIDVKDADLHEMALIVRIFETHMRFLRSFASDKSRERETANLLRGVREALEERIARESPAKSY